MKNLISILCTMCILLIATTMASANGTIRVAQLPILVDSSAVVSQETSTTLQARFQQELQRTTAAASVQYVSEQECLTAYRKVVNDLNGVSDTTAILKPLAQELNADIVLQPVIMSCQQKDYMHLNDTMSSSSIYTRSLASIDLIGYDRRQDEVFQKNAALTYNAEPSYSGMAAYLAQECMHSVLQQALSTRI